MSTNAFEAAYAAINGVGKNAAILATFKMRPRSIPEANSLVNRESESIFSLIISLSFSGGISSNEPYCPKPALLITIKGL